MTHHHKRALFIFRQDLRIRDNTGLRKALSVAKEVIPVFIFDTDILDDFPDNDKRVGFLVDAVADVNEALHQAWSQLYTYHGKATNLIPELIKQRDCDCIVRNRSYGQWSRKRDVIVEQRADFNECIIYTTPDYLLVEPDLVDQRKVFTPFYKLRMQVPKIRQLTEAPKSINTPNKHPVHCNQFRVFLNNKPALLKQIGWAEQSVWSPADGKALLDRLPLKDYTEHRNFPAIDGGTARLSPHLAFGTVSIREVFHHALAHDAEWVNFDADHGTIFMDKKIFKNSFISELARREFWQHIAYYFPESWETEFQDKRRWLARNDDKKRLDKRKNGETGYPIVDAAMKQLKAENRMHGRCRMIVASFLTKDLMIDRRHGEEHFKNYLLDYDKAVNIGNRQRSASVWADPKPLRIFNPMLQSSRYDPKTDYITHRLPELKGQAINAIHDPLQYPLDYIEPIVDHYVMQRKARNMYKKESFDL